MLVLMAVRRDRRPARGIDRRKRRAVALAVGVYGLSQLVSLLRGRATGPGRRNAFAVLRAERWLVIDVEQRVQRAFLARPAALALCNVIYVANQFVITPAALWAVHRREPGVYAAARDRILVALFGATLWHAVQPVVPPRSLGIGIVDTVSRFTPLNLDSRLTRSIYNPNAAMPSLHMATALLTSRAMWDLGGGPVGRPAAVIYPGLVAAAVVATGNHFVLDIVGGSALAAAATLLIRRRV